MSNQNRLAVISLSAKQKAFVTAYLINGFNATKAAIAAGYANGSAHVTGSRLLRNAKVAAAIKRELERRGMTPTNCTIKLCEIAFGSDIADFWPWLRGEKTLRALAEGGVNTSLVKSARTRRGGKREIVLYDRIAALSELARVLNIVSKQSSGSSPCPSFTVCLPETLE